MKTKNDLTEMLRRMGLKKLFWPYREPETGALLLQVKRPAQIIEGRLAGEQIDIYRELPLTFRVWTSRTNRARHYARLFGLRLRQLTGESELYIPGHLADDLLPKFGAKVKRVVSAEQREVLKTRLAQIRPQNKATWEGQDTAPAI